MYENREQTGIQENQELLQQMDITNQSLNWRNQREEQNKEEITFGTTCRRRKESCIYKWIVK